MIILSGTVFLLTSHKSPSPAPPPVAARHQAVAYAEPVGKAAADVAVYRRANQVPAPGPDLQDRQRHPGAAADRPGEADIVYLLPVEGGLSRIFAVFSSHVPPVVGPVRSSRQEDIKLLRQFGRPAFAFSGAQPALLPVVEHARIVNLYAGIVGGYFRDWSRVEPYNLYADTKTLLREAPHASLARDIGFRFGAAPAGGKPTHSYSVGYQAAHFTFWWSPKQHRWLVSMDGSPARAANGRKLGGRTIVVQYVRVGTSVFRELGIRPPYANTVGQGSAVVLRNGRAYHVHWSRPRANGGTTFTLPDGHRMPFARGQVWVVYGLGPGSTG